MIERFRLLGLLYKEFSLLFKRWQAPLLIILLPLIIVIVFSAGSSASPGGVVGVCDFDGVGSIVNDDFRVVFLNSSNQSLCYSSLVEGVKAGDFVVGLVIPQGFVLNVSQGSQGFIGYVVDDSNPLTASIAGLFLEQSINGYSAGLVKSFEAELHRMALTARSRINGVTVILNSSASLLGSDPVSSFIGSYLSSAVNELLLYDEDLSFVQGLSVEFLTKPVVLNRLPVYPGVSASSFNFAAVFAIISLFSLLLISSTGVIFDRKSSFIVKVKVSRVFVSSYLLSKVVFYFVISLVQLLIVMLLMLSQGAVFDFSFSSFIASLLVVTAVNSSIGLLIGLLSNNDVIAVLLSLTLSLPFLFLSGVFFPLEFMPSYLQFFARLVPLNAEILLLKQSMILGYSLPMLESLIIDLSVFSLVLLAVDYFVIKFKC